LKVRDFVLLLCGLLAGCAQQTRVAPILPGPVQVILPKDPLAAKLRAPASLLRVPAAVEAQGLGPIRVLQLQRPGSGLVDITLLVHYPRASDAAVARVMATALTSSERVIDGTHIAQRSADMGSALLTHSEAGVSWFTLRVLRSELVPAAQLLAAVVRAPLADDKTIDLARQRVRLQVMGLESVAGNLAEARLLGAMYPRDDPLARLWPSLEQLAAVSVAKVQAFQRRWYRPDDSVIILSGDFDAQVVNVLSSAFSGWQASSQGAVGWTSFTRPLETGPRLLIEARSAAAQVEVRVGLPGPDIRSSDYPAMRVLVSLLGGGPSGRLFKDLRERQGLTYSVSAGLWRRGLLVISLAMAHDKFAAAVSAVQQHLQSLVDSPPAAAEVDQVKRRLAAELAVAVETTDDLAGLGIELARSGLPADFLSRLQARIQRITAADIRRVIAKYLGANPTVVAVGNEPELRRDLRRLLPDLASAGQG